MSNAETFRNIAISLPHVTEEPHFDKTSFRVAKKIFATMDADAKRAMVKLPLPDQDVICTSYPGVIYPVPNKWGEKGATFINLALVQEAMLSELLKIAFKNTAPKDSGDAIHLA